VGVLSTEVVAKTTN